MGWGKQPGQCRYYEVMVPLRQTGETVTAADGRTVVKGQRFFEAGGTAPRLVRQLHTLVFIVGHVHASFVYPVITQVTLDAGLVYPDRATADATRELGWTWIDLNVTRGQ